MSVQVIDWAPEPLSWIWLDRKYGDSPACYVGSFRAVADDRLFSLNVLDGTVLVDGLPLGSLPAEITEHRLFK